jgi:hypothetical protein
MTNVEGEYRFEANTERSTSQAEHPMKNAAKDISPLRLRAGA